MFSPELLALGWSPFFEEQWSPFASSERVPARVIAEHRGQYQVAAPHGVGPARLAGRFRKSADEAALPGVGDWVALDAAPSPERIALIEGLLERRTLFTRGAAGRGSAVQVVAANVDVVFVVSGLDADFNLRRIERYLARIRASGAEPVVILSKADLATDLRANVMQVETRAPGIRVHPVSAVSGEGVAALREHLAPGVTTALVGSSGAGKSTLVNALLGEERMETNAVRAHDGRGRHTTSHRELLALPGGGLLLDTPGMRELQLLDEEGLDAAFDEISSLAQECRFADCSHTTEPGCALRAAEQAGTLDPDRLDHFLQLQQEARAHQRRRDERMSRIDQRAFGRLAREARKYDKRRRGDS